MNYEYRKYLMKFIIIARSWLAVRGTTAVTRVEHKRNSKKNTLMCSHISGKMHSSLQNALASFCKEMQGASLPESAKIISNNKTSSGWSK